MHSNAMQLLKEHLPNGEGTCYDIGSYDICGNPRTLVERKGYTYIGLDIREGPNVDVVVPEFDSWPVPLVDTVISVSALEHAQRPWEFMANVSNTLNTGGIAVIIAPWKWRMHGHPLDCFRILPDGMRSLFEYAGMEVLDVGFRENDTYGVGRVN